jgi:hypothetical protein
MKKIYISGPISNHPTGNIELFAAEALKIRQGGDIAVNPHEVCAHLPKTSPWDDFMQVCIEELSSCDAILMLPGWQESKGANVEYEKAKEMGIEIYHFYQSGDEMKIRLMAGRKEMPSEEKKQPVCIKMPALVVQKLNELGCNKSRYITNAVIVQLKADGVPMEGSEG